ncbi:hypothetical protein ACUIJN_24460 [Metabacillus halosaccharovorans]|uniref:hypothetical protein n=1 Tax=Metabacillus halosaccharovorans TaxID=930124 RepID=UPI00203BBA8F|nr:hypothetical protein [Metabacillus halosaccharovorans]MCM3439759.1 hypothetical protein [Metabacillus halosaccharovorans]
MEKNPPLLWAMFLVGLSLRSIVSNANLSPIFYWSIVVISTVLLVWSMIAFILNLGVQKYEKILSETDQ